MRKWILNLHLYGGLVFCSYLLIFGFSSLYFNHPFAFAQPQDQLVTWERPLKIQPLPDNNAYAESIRDQLGLMGWPLPWKTTRDANDSLHFDLSRPGKHYTIHALAAENLVRVEEHRTGYWPVINALHALMKVPNSRVASCWGVYTELCTLFVVFSAIAGVYLWASQKRERVIGTWILCGAVAISVAFMVYARIGG